MKRSFNEFSNQKSDKIKNNSDKNTDNLKSKLESNRNSKQKQENLNFKSKQFNIEDTINKYKDMSQSDLLTNLFSEVSKQKQQGTFDIEKIENAISSLGIYLTSEQQSNMRELLKKFK